MGWRIQYVNEPTILDSSIYWNYGLQARARRQDKPPTQHYTGFHKLTILGSSIYETSAGLQQNLENEIEMKHGQINRIEKPGERR